MNATEQTRSGWVIPTALAVSVGLHVGLFALLAQEPPPKTPDAEPVEFVLVEKEPPPPPPPPPPEPIPDPVVEEKPAPKPPPVVAKKEPLPPPTPNTPPPAEPPPPDAKPAPIKIGISLSSTTEGGSFAVGTGNTLYGKADAKAADPNEVKPYQAGETKQAPYVPSSRVTSLPSVSKVVDPGYTPEATRERIEGQVIMRVKIDAEGKVVDVRVIKGLGYGLDERAVDAMRRTRFKPAKAGGEAVGTEISYTLTFFLQD